MEKTTLIEWRKRLGMSQAAAAEKLGCGRRSLQRWEDGSQAIPRYIALACSAVSLNLIPYGDQAQ